MIVFKHKGDFSKSTKYLERLKKPIINNILEDYAKEGLAALQAATPKDTGLTARSWSYEIVNKNGSVSITYSNSNIQNGVLVAILLQYGHGTRNGGWVEGIDYINPTIQPIFNEIAKKVWREVTRV